MAWRSAASACSRCAWVRLSPSRTPSSRASRAICSDDAFSRTVDRSDSNWQLRQGMLLSPILGYSNDGEGLACAAVGAGAFSVAEVLVSDNVLIFSFGAQADLAFRFQLAHDLDRLKLSFGDFASTHRAKNFHIFFQHFHRARRHHFENVVF